MAIYTVQLAITIIIITIKHIAHQAPKNFRYSQYTLNLAESSLNLTYGSHIRHKLSDHCNQSLWDQSNDNINFKTH